MNKLAAEAIADAKALKEMAVANAQLALAESFRDKVESLVNEKIDSDILEMEDDDDVDSENDDENDDSVDESHESSDDDEDTKADDGEDLDENSEALDGEDDDEEEDDDEDGLGLDEIIAELEASLKKENTKSAKVVKEEADDEEEKEDEDEVNEEDDSEDDSEDDEDSEKFDLDELLASIGDMDFDHNTKKVNESAKITSLNEKLKTVQTERDEYKEAVIFMKEKLSEVNLLNAKLLYANKLFQAYSMTNEQKVKVIESLDRTNSVHEVKLIYSTLAESLKFGSKPTMRKSSSIMEGLSSAKIGSTAPDEKKIISEARDGNQRLQFLAGIIK